MPGSVSVVPTGLFLELPKGVYGFERATYLIIDSNVTVQNC